MTTPRAPLMLGLKPNRRWARFSLRRLFLMVTLLGMLTLLCAALTVLVPAERQRRAVAGLSAVGGWVEYAKHADADKTKTASLAKTLR